VAEIRRALRPRGTLIIIAEIYKGASTKIARLVEKHAPKTGIKVLSPDEHRNLLSSAGHSDIKVVAQATERWICAMGTKLTA
jgi:hypothetical protein